MVGIVSSTDIARAYQAAESFSGSQVLAKHLMTDTVLVTWPDEALAAAVERMMERRVHRLVVVPGPQDTRHAIGILSLTDLAQRLRTHA